MTYCIMYTYTILARARIKEMLIYSEISQISLPDHKDLQRIFAAS